MNREKDLERFWIENPLQECRYNYDLDEDSIVLDIGGHEGKWAERIYSLYMPQINIFEPHPKYIDILKNKFKKYLDVFIWEFGVSNSSGKDRLTNQGPESNCILREGETIEIQTLDAADLVRNITVDLMKINAEGSEYYIIIHLWLNKLLKNIKNIQVQFHEIEDFGYADFVVINDILQKTHELTYDYGMVWQNWRLK